LTTKNVAETAYEKDSHLLKLVCGNFARNQKKEHTPEIKVNIVEIKL